MTSLHASSIAVVGQNVEFVCEELSPNTITLPLYSTQDIHTADAGSSERPVVQLTITINGVEIPKASINLNDRSNMDSPLLIGQNVLSQGDFIIDPSKVSETVVLQQDLASLTEIHEICMDSMINLEKLLESTRSVITDLQQKRASLFEKVNKHG
jgi:predicted aspartyl protease